MQDGRTRTYGPFRRAATNGEMTGAAKGKEFNPTTGASRSWTETCDQAGRVRIVRPFYGDLPHCFFGPDGDFLGTF